MKLHKLELTGFGPFRERQVVDFDAFDRDGIFLIAGRTGAGKSSILDGVCFALYGTVPRYDSGEKRLRSDHCEPEDPTEVRLEFTVGERRWCITRAPEYQRPARRGGGLTTEPTRAELEELVGDTWIGRAAKPREVGLLLDDVLGLNAQQFQQVILLAQNKFSRFLLASGSERQGLLRALFGSRRYEEYARELGERSKAAQRELDARAERARTLLDQAERLIAGNELGGADAAGDLTARRAAVVLGAERAAYRLDTLTHARELADAARASADADHRAVVAVARAQSELRQARDRLAALEAASPGIADDRADLDRARAAEALRATLDAVRRTEADSSAASAAAAIAEQTWDAAAQGAQIDRADDLDAVIERLTGELAMWSAAAAQEAELVAREDELRAGAERVTAMEADLAAMDSQRALVPGELERLDRELAAARQDAAHADPARTRRDELAGRLEAAREAEKLAGDLRNAEVAHRDAATVSAAAGAAVASLLQRRLDGYAGELAATLVHGEPCAVCGSATHPHPAPVSDDPVTDDDLTAAEAEREAAAARERSASDAARAARERHAVAAARAAGEAPGVLEEQLEEATALVQAAEDAAARCTALEAERAALVSLDAEAEAARGALADELAQARSQVAALTARVAGVRAVVAQARGEYASVAERVAAVTGVRESARAYSHARATARHAEAVHANALADAEALVAASVFADADTAAAALREPGTVTALAARIAEHDAQLTATRSRVLELELELAGTPDEPVDVATSQAALDAADAARTTALAAESEARSLSSALRDLVLQLDEAYAGVAERAADAAAIARLADTVAGRAPNSMKMDLETFVLAAELEEIVDSANLRLGDMSSGRYRLQHSDARAARGAASGLGLEIVDAFTGQARPAQSLSGGETFLASLALALGLAEVVTARAGGVRLDTLFIDEGFGSLDEETLELAMRTLDELRQGGRTVGVISHVAAMKEQLPAQLIVQASPHGPSAILQDDALAGVV
ncbi:SMC family ATPase [Microbacterium sp. HD4P20]|uniref:AAA family ATPase n=1 Tax=Microbacterium sp. HD4P20 TaxID=2864874 RepID=UPI001C640F7E|nr:SMC family ATPase [Microbacterium sp. HD4P20]MCP2636206.1 SMC family ATPase [Microbacterium sp. HD4P20]